MRQIPGITDLETSVQPGLPAYAVRLRPDAVRELGLTPTQLAASLRSFVNDDVATYWTAPDGEQVEVELRLPQVLKRQALERRVAINAGLENRPLGDVMKEVNAAMKSIALPDGVRFDVGGQSQQMEETMVGFAIALGIAIIFIYLVLASQFGSFLQPIAIMTALPLSLIGVLLALLITKSTLNIFSIIGVVMLMGLVTKNAILLVDFANQGQREGKSQFAALMEAGQVRLRPILMTTLAMIFGMLPMALGLGEGAENQASMGRAVIGGVITSTLLTLVVVPVAYTYLDSFGKRAKRWFQKGHEVDAELTKPAEGQAI
jgi:multidrug efflux pump subunit AcrB